MNRRTKTIPPGTFDFESLSDRQKEAVWEECEKIGPDDGGPLGPGHRKAHAMARRRGRPRRGEGSEILSISMERSLVRAADAFARQHRLSRSELVSRGVRAVLVAAGLR